MSEAGSSLCQACGFCCDGTLFDGIFLTDTDVVSVARVRLPVFRDDERPILRLPCTAHVGACTVYEDRPSICRSYQCELVNRLDAGDIDLPGALLRVERLRALIDAIRPHLGDQGESFWERAEALQARPFTWQIQLENEALMLQIATLREMLARFIDARSRRGNAV
ncbi:MAG: YkgJ family cysteine cluster protein [Byssovorax sp.]